MIVLSYFCALAPASLANHRSYAGQLGYHHEWIDASGMPSALQSRCFYKYEVLLNTLRRADPGEIVLMLTEHAAILQPVALDRLMDERDWLLVATEDTVLPQVEVQIWRNTQSVQRLVMEVVQRCRLGGRMPMSEAELFAGFEEHRWNWPIEGVIAVMRAGFDIDPAWVRVPTFAISIDNLRGDSESKLPESSKNPRFRDLLVNSINQQLLTGQQGFSFPQRAHTQDAERSTYNPGQPIALMTLYTPNISSYARIAEDNFRRYCESNGYTLYIYRDIPREIELDASGNWLKPWLLHGYMRQHEWVVWLDADILINDHRKKFEPMLEGRDILVARDIGQWIFNSGVMGFRRTAQNEAMLHELMVSISKLFDRSSVYANGGDQRYFIEALTNNKMLRDGDIVDSVALNTYWEYRRSDSFIVHYAGMWPELRALVMAHDDALALQ